MKNNVFQWLVIAVLATIVVVHSFVNHRQGEQIRKQDARILQMEAVIYRDILNKEIPRRE